MKKEADSSAISLRNNPKGLAKLRREVEKAKQALSSATQVRIEIENIDGQHDLSEVLTRARFEQLNHDLFMKTLEPLKTVLKESGLSKSQIDEVILVGGSTRIPKIQELVSQFFNGKQLNRGVNPDEVVAQGAAIQAAMLMPDHHDRFENTLVLDTTPLSLGIETVGGVMTPIIPKNTKFPTSKSQTFSTYQDNQAAVGIKIFQGERARTQDNRFLGDFLLDGIAPAPRGVPQIEVTFDIDVNGILNVHARDIATSQSNSITITADHTRLSQDEINKMRQDATEFEEHDRGLRATVEAKNRLESSVYRLRSWMQQMEGQGTLDQVLTSEEVEIVKEIVTEVSNWLDSNENAPLEALEEKQHELDSMVQPILGKMYQTNDGGSSGGHPGGGGYEGHEDDGDHEDL